MFLPTKLKLDPNNNFCLIQNVGTATFLLFDGDTITMGLLNIDT